MRGRKVIVTGASSGLGRHITRRLVRDGAHVLATARRGELLAEVAEELSNASGEISTHEVDVTDPESVAGMVANAAQELGSIDALVNNAGMEIQGSIDDLGLDEMQAMLATNVVGPYLCIKAALPHLEESKGVVVNIGSTVTTRPPFNRFGYVASKGALESMTRALSGDLGPRGVRVNMVRPGIVPSELRGMSEDAEREALANRTPALQALKFVGDGTDVAGAVAYLISDDGNWVTGTILDVDGGYALGVIHPKPD